MITLKTLPQASAQEVFDQVAGHLLKQNEQSKENWDDGASCEYHATNGLRCAAGCLIGDDEYDPIFEGAVWDVLVVEHGFPSNHKFLIESLQRIHDRAPPQDWRDCLKACAEAFQLEWRF